MPETVVAPPAALVDRYTTRICDGVHLLEVAAVRDRLDGDESSPDRHRSCQGAATRPRQRTEARQNGLAGRAAEGGTPWPSNLRPQPARKQPPRTPEGSVRQIIGFRPAFHSRGFFNRTAAPLFGVCPHGDAADGFERHDGPQERDVRRLQTPALHASEHGPSCPRSAPARWRHRRVRRRLRRRCSCPAAEYQRRRSRMPRPRTRAIAWHDPSPTTHLDEAAADPREAPQWCGRRRELAICSRIADLVLADQHCAQTASECAPSRAPRRPGNLSAIAGLRISPSTRITERPDSASAAARSMAVVVRPSPAEGLVTAMQRGGPEPSGGTVNRRLVRNSRTRSA